MTSTASVHLQGILGHMYALRRLYLDYVLVSPNTSYVSSKRPMRPYKIWSPPTTRPPRPSAESQVSHFHTSGRHCCNNHQIPGEFQIFTNKEADCAPPEINSLPNTHLRTPRERALEVDRLHTPPTRKKLFGREILTTRSFRDVGEIQQTQVAVFEAKRWVEDKLRIGDSKRRQGAALRNALPDAKATRGRRHRLTTNIASAYYKTN